MPWYVETRDPPPPPPPPLTAAPTLFEWVGGLPALTRMTRLLYEKQVPADDLLAPLFATMAPEHPRREAAVLAEAFGGPAAPQQTRAGQNFSEPQRARWVALATLAADEAGPPARPPLPAAPAAHPDCGSPV